MQMFPSTDKHVMKAGTVMVPASSNDHYFI